MENITMTMLTVVNITQLPERLWIRDEIFVACLTVISLYLTVALSIFECRYNGNRNEPKESDWKTKVENFLSSGTLCLVAVIITLIRCFCEQIELRLGTVSNIACRIYQHQLSEVYHLALTSLYLLLWIRQLKLYRHRALKHLSSPLLRFISYTVMLGILGSSAASLISYMVTFTLKASSRGCVYDVSLQDGPPSSLPGILLFAIAVVFQTSLLGLMVYPLIKQYEVHICGETSDKAKKYQNVRKTINRLSICTAICILSDGISSYLLVFVNDGTSPISFWANIYTVNLLFNIIAVVCSFADRKRRLFPCIKQDYTAVASTSASSGNSAV